MSDAHGPFDTGHAHGEGVIAVADGFCVIASTDRTRERQFRPWISMLDGNGQTVWERLYGDTETLGRAVTVCPGGDLIAVGERRVGEQRAYQGWIARIGPDGGVRWQRAFGVAGMTNLKSVCAIDDDTIVAVGMQQLCGWFLGVDGDGEMRWQHRVDDVELLTGCAASETGDIVASATVERPTVGLGQAGLIAVTAQGARSWQTRCPHDVGGQLEALVCLSDGGVAVGRRETMRAPGVWLRRWSAQGQIAWEYGRASTRSEIGRAVAIMADGDVAIVGDSYETIADRRAWTWRFSPTGELKWHAPHGAVGRTYGRAITATHDNGILMVGTTPVTQGNTAALIARIDADGTSVWSHIRKQPVLG